MKVRRFLGEVSEKGFSVLFDCGRKLSRMASSKDNAIGKAVDLVIGALFFIPLLLTIELGHIAEVGHL